MKKLVLILTFTFPLIAVAQNWSPTGATWYYSDESATMSGYSKLTYTHDTIINSLTCKIITHYAEGDGIFGHYAGFRFSSPYFTYEQNGVAYLYNNKEGNNKFDTLFNINAQIGDKWRFPLVDTICADSTYFMKVLNTGTKTLNGFNLKWLYIKAGPFPYAGSGSFISGFDTITERLGPRYDDICYSSCYNSPDECAHGGLRCYSDDAFGVYSTGLTSPCDYLTGIAESQIGQGVLKIYPNPVTTELEIEFRDTHTLQNIIIEIKNMLGQTVKTFDSRLLANCKNKIEIDVSELSKGLYFVQLQNENNILSKKFVKH